MIFNRTKTFNGRLIFDASSLSEISRSLLGAGFSDIKIKIPEKGYKNIPAREFLLDEFIKLEYNFDAQILVAKNEKEAIKILFVNRSNAVSSFNDTTFPSGHSVRPSMYVESDDPVRLVGILDFAKNLLIKSSKRSFSLAKTQNYLYMFASLYLFGIFGLLIAVKDNFNKDIFLEHWFLSFILPLLFIFYLLYHIIHPGGLYVRNFEHPLVSFYTRISAGDLRNNLIIVFFIWIFKVVIAGLIIGIGVNLFSNPVKEILVKIFS